MSSGWIEPSTAPTRLNRMNQDLGKMTPCSQACAVRRLTGFPPSQEAKEETCWNGSAPAGSVWPMPSAGL